jgi:PPE-repeat protein
MTAPVWMAFPPEVHSALLSSGPGPGGLLASAGSWSSLSATYAAVADELSAILAAVQAGAWEGPSAERYVAAHVPYLAWLMRASAKSAAAATQHETAAAAYTTALAAMPTLPELAANHVIHGALVATNFFGINTIPIALNEADYVRMWVQAATTMSTYEVVSTTALASAPETDPAPQIVNSSSSSPRPADGIYGGGGNSDKGILPIVDNDSGDPYNLSWWINRLLEYPLTIQRDIGLIMQNPGRGLIQLGYDIVGVTADETGHAIQAVEYFPQLTALPFAVPAGFAGGFAGMGGLAGIQPEAAPAVAATPMPQTPSVPVTSGTPAVSPAPASVPAAAPASVPASPPATMPATAPAAGAPPPPPAGIEAAAYPYMVGGPAFGASTGMSSSAQRKAWEPDAAAAAAAAAASARAKQSARRRKRAGMRGYGDEFMDMNIQVDPEWGGPAGEEPVASTAGSERGAGNLGFAGTARKDAVVEASGLTKLAGDGFGGGPSIPMLPSTWEPDQEDLGDGESTR